VKSFIGFGLPETKAAEQVLHYQPGGIASGGARLAAAIRGGRTCLVTLRVTLTSARYSFGNGEFNWANASRGWLMTGALAKTGSGGETFVGRLASKTMASGHLCTDLMRIIDLSTRPSRKKV
jgi:hypothetical protein